jgi:hypothetical protein
VVLSRQYRNQPSKRRRYGNLLPHSQPHTGRVRDRGDRPDRHPLGGRPGPDGFRRRGLGQDPRAEPDRLPEPRAAPFAHSVRLGQLYRPGARATGVDGDGRDRARPARTGPVVGDVRTRQATVRQRLREHPARVSGPERSRIRR